MLGQPASSQTVCRPPERTSALSSVYCGPVRARVRIHDGLRSIGVSLLRTSRRRSLRPSGAIVTVATLRRGRRGTVSSRGHDPGSAEGDPEMSEGTVPSVGERIRELRKDEARGQTMSQTALAAAADVSVDVIRKLEQPSANYTPSIPTLQRIATALDVD